MIWNRWDSMVFLGRYCDVMLHGPATEGMIPSQCWTAPMVSMVSMECANPLHPPWFGPRGCWIWTGTEFIGVGWCLGVSGNQINQADRMASFGEACRISQSTCLDYAEMQYFVCTLAAQHHLDGLTLGSFTLQAQRSHQILLVPRCTRPCCSLGD